MRVSLSSVAHYCSHHARVIVGAGYCRRCCGSRGLRKNRAYRHAIDLVSSLELRVLHTETRRRFHARHCIKEINARRETVGSRRWSRCDGGKHVYVCCRLVHEIRKRIGLTALIEPLVERVFGAHKTKHMKEEQRV